MPHPSFAQITVPSSGTSAPLTSFISLNEGTYDTQAAERSWEHSIAFLAADLAPPAAA
jgi:hypothetical protein